MNGADARDTTNDDNGVINRTGAYVNLLATVACSGIAMSVPMYANPDTGDPKLPSAVVFLLEHLAAIFTLLTAALLLEFIVYRSGIRPRLRWNESEILITYPFRQSKVKWTDVYAIRIDGIFKNEVIVHLENESIAWEFDRMWLASRLSKKYAAKASRHEQQLEHAFQTLSGVQREPTNILVVPGRPIWMYILAVTVAALAWIIY